MTWHMTWHISGRIDDSVPLTTFQRIQLSIPIAVQLPHLGEEIAPRASAVEERDGVPPRQREFRHMNAEEACATQQQDLQWLAGFGGQPSGSTCGEGSGRCGGNEATSVHGATHSLVFEPIAYARQAGRAKESMANGP